MVTFDKHGSGIVIASTRLPVNGISVFLMTADSLNTLCSRYGKCGKSDKEAKQQL